MQLPKFNILFSSIILFFIVGFLLFYKLNSYPQTLYNWENYPVWNIFQLKFQESNANFRLYLKAADGLMTESGTSPIIGFPMYVITSVLGYNFFNLRIWTTTLTLLGAVLFYVFTTRLFGNKVGTFASLMFCCSQAFLLYGRTATNVGPTLLAEMITVTSIYYLLKSPGSVKFGMLSIFVLIFNYFFYAPIRFFSPFLLLVIIRFFNTAISEIINKLSIKNLYAFYLKRILITVIILLATFFLWMGRTWTSAYFNGRGEHFLSFITSQSTPRISLPELNDKISVNFRSYLNLFFSIDSRPVIIDFGNQYGQMISKALVPFFIIGILILMSRLRSKNDNKYLLLLIWFLLTSIPIIFTSNVHIGRLFLSLAPMYIIISVGFITFLTGFLQWIEKTMRRSNHATKIVVYILTIIFSFGIFQAENHAYFFTKPTVDHNIKVLQEKRELLLSKNIYLLNAENSTLHFWEIVYYLKSKVFFIDNKTFVALDRFRNANQVSEGWLFRNNSDYRTLAMTCLRSDSVLIIIGKYPESKEPPISPVCHVPTIRLYQ